MMEQAHTEGQINVSEQQASHGVPIDVNPPLQASASSIPVLPAISANRERFMKVAYPVFAGVPTAIIILFSFDFGETYKTVLEKVLSPIITGVTSGFILYILGLKR